MRTTTELNRPGNRRKLPPRDARGRFVSPRTLAAAAARDQSRRRDRRSAMLHWVGLVALPWALVAWTVLP